MFINNTTVRVNDRGFNLEEVYFSDAVDTFNNDYDSTLMTGTYNDFGREKNRDIAPSSRRFNLELRVEEWKLNLYTETDELIGNIEIIHIRKEFTDVYDFESPWSLIYTTSPVMAVDGNNVINVSELSNNEYRTDKYHISQIRTKLTCAYIKDTEQSNIQVPSELAIWNTSSWGRMDKVIDISMPDEEHWNGTSRWKLGMKHTDNCVYIIDALNNEIYKKDIYVSNALTPHEWSGDWQPPVSEGSGTSYLQQIMFPKPDGGTLWEGISVPSPGETIIKMKDGMPGVGIRGLCNLKLDEHNQTGDGLGQSFPCVMTTFDFGNSPASDPYIIQKIWYNYPGGVNYREELRPHEGYECLAWMHIRNIGTPSSDDCKVIIGSTWTCLLEGAWAWEGLSSGDIDTEWSAHNYQWVKDPSIRVIDLFNASPLSYVDLGGGAYGWDDDDNRYPYLVFGSDEKYFNNKYRTAVDAINNVTFTLGKSMSYNFGNNGTNMSVSGYGLHGFDYVNGGQAGSFLMAATLPKSDTVYKQDMWDYAHRTDTLVTRMNNESKVSVMLANPVPVTLHPGVGPPYSVATPYVPGVPTLNIGSWADDAADGDAHHVPIGNYFIYDNVHHVGGSHSGGNGESNLIISALEFGSAGSLIGKILINITKEAKGIITNNGANWIGTSAGMMTNGYGASDYVDWDNGDVYRVVDQQMDSIIHHTNITREFRYIIKADGYFGLSTYQDSRAVPAATISNNHSYDLGNGLCFRGDFKYLQHLDSPSGNYYNNTSEQTFLYYVDGTFIKRAGRVRCASNGTSNYFFGEEPYEEVPYKGPILIQIARHVWDWGYQSSYYGWNSLDFWDTQPHIHWPDGGCTSDIIEEMELDVYTNWDNTTNLESPPTSDPEGRYALGTTLAQYGTVGFDLTTSDKRIMISNSLSYPGIAEALIEDILSNDDHAYTGLQRGLPSIILLDSYHGDGLEYDDIYGACLLRDAGSSNDKNILCMTTSPKLYGRKKNSSFSFDTNSYNRNFSNEHTDVGMREFYEDGDESKTKVFMYDITKYDGFRTYYHENVFVEGNGIDSTLNLDILSIDLGKQMTYSSTNNAHRNNAGELRAVGNLMIGSEIITCTSTTSLDGSLGGITPNPSNRLVSSCTVTHTGYGYNRDCRIGIVLTTGGVKFSKDKKFTFTSFTHNLTRWDWNYYRLQFANRYTEDSNLHCEDNNEAQDIPGYQLIPSPGLGNSITFITSHDRIDEYRLLQIPFDDNLRLELENMKESTSYETSSVDEFAGKEDRYVVKDGNYVTNDGEDYVYI